MKPYTATPLFDRIKFILLIIFHKFQLLFSTTNATAKMISIIVIPTAKIVGLNDKPMNSAKNGITIENSKYTLDLADCKI